MKKTLAVVLTMVVALSTAACGASGSGKSAKGEGVMTYAEYAAAELDSEVVVETYVPSIHRMLTADTSSTNFHAQRKITTSLFPEPRSKLQVTSQSGQEKLRSLMQPMR